MGGQAQQTRGGSSSVLHMCLPSAAYDVAVADDHTTAVVQHFLDQLADVSGDAPAAEVDAIVRELLAGAVDRLHLLCASLLFRSYRRLTHPPLNLQPDEMLSAVVERMLKAMRSIHPHTVRQFFALANQHMRWELNDLARRLDHQAQSQPMRESAEAFAAAPARPAAPDGSASQPSPNARRILDAIESLPSDQREVFDLVRIQGMTQPEASAALGVSSKTIQRRLNRSLLQLADKLIDLQPPRPTAAVLGRSNFDMGLHESR